MAKSRLSVSASRILLGLGVVGLSATSALAGPGDVTLQGNDIVILDGSSNKTIAISDNKSINSLTVSGQGNAVNVTGDKTLTISESLTISGGQLSLSGSGAIGKIVSKDIKLNGNGELKLTASGGATSNELATVTGTGNKITYAANDASEFNAKKGLKIGDDKAKADLTVTVAGANNKFNVSGGALEIAGGSSLTFSGTGGTVGNFKVQDGLKFTGTGNTLTISGSAIDFANGTNEIHYQGTGNQIVLDTGSEFKASKGFKISGAVSPAKNGEAQSTVQKSSLTIKAGTAAGKFTVDTSALELAGNADLIFKDLGADKLDAAEGVKFTGGNNTLTLDNTTLSGSSSGKAITASSLNNTIILKGTVGIIDTSKMQTVTVDGASGASLTIVGNANNQGKVFTSGGNNEIAAVDIGKTNGNGTLTFKDATAETTLTALTMGAAGSGGNVLNIENSNIKAALTANGQAIINLTKGGKYTGTDVGALTFKEGGIITVDGTDSKFTTATQDTTFKGEGSQIILTNGGQFVSDKTGATAIKVDSSGGKSNLSILLDDKANTLFDVSGGGITVGDANNDASLTIQGATADNFKIKAETGIALGADADKNYTLNLENSSLKTAVTVQANATSNINLTNSTLDLDVKGFNAAGNTTIKMIGENSTFKAKGDSGSTAALAVADGKTLTIEGGNVEIVDGAGKAEFKIGSAAAATATFKDNKSVTIDKLIMHDSAGNTLNLINSKNVTINKAVTLADTANKNVFKLEDSKITFKEAGRMFTGSNKGTFDLIGDSSIALEGASGALDVAGSVFNVTTYGVLDTNKTIMTVAGSGSSLTGAGTLNVNYRQDANALLVGTNYTLEANKYFNNFAVFTGSAMASGGGSSEYAKTVVSGYELKVDGSNLVVNSTLNTSKVSASEKAWAAAKDKTATANEIKTDGKLTADVATALEAKTAAQRAYDAVKNGQDQAAINAAKTALDNATKKYNNLKGALDTITTLASKVVGEKPKEGEAVSDSVIESLGGEGVNVDVGRTTIAALDNSDTLSSVFTDDSFATTPKNYFRKTVDAQQRAQDVKVADAIFVAVTNASASADTKRAEEVAKAVSHPDFFLDTEEGAKSSTNFNDASSSVNAAISIANDMALGSRVAMFNNPYLQNDAKRFAALGSDAAFDYYDTYKRSVWANAFGGVNIIDGDNGGLIGVSAGIDSYLSDNFLLGAYMTYANSTVKDNTLEQKSNNFLLGVYSLYKFAPTWELNLKASLQFSPTDQDHKVGGSGTASSDFTRTAAALSANVGKVFNAGSGFYIKPFLGANYYYTYTPDYTENGATLNKQVKSQDNNSLSLEAGAEFRMYVSDTSYIYVTPKLEQYVLNDGDAFTSNYAGGTSIFTLKHDDKKKTYGQLVLGGNMDINEALSLNAGLGVKQILANKVNDNNETFVTGNVGLKYRF